MKDQTDCNGAYCCCVCENMMLFQNNYVCQKIRGGKNEIIFKKFRHGYCNKFGLYWEAFDIYVGKTPLFMVKKVEKQ